VTSALLFALSILFGLLLAEARVSRRNEHALRARGATAPPGDVYPWMTVLYPGAFLAMGLEGVMGPHAAVASDRRLGLFVSGALLFVASKALKYWAVSALGERWTFRVFIVPGAPLVTTGPYRYVTHPNYIAVIGELVATAMMMGAWVTGPVMLAAFGAALWARIRFENKVLNDIRSSFSLRRGATLLALLAVPIWLQAQGPGRGATADAVRQVRVALGHGSGSDAQRAAAAAPAGAGRELATALVEIYQGNDDGARPRLQALVSGGARGEAALELGLLEMRHGRRDAARQLLEPLTRQTLSTTDDYFLLARAARAIHEFQLANDAYNRVTNAGRADVFAERGDLFLQFHQPADAVTEFQSALKADPSWVPAHVGMARALADDEPAASSAALDAARKLAPESPDVLMFDAEQQLAAEDAAAATAALDRVAKSRPGTAREFGLRAAVAYLERKPAEIDAALARVHGIDATTALGERLVAQEAARKYRFNDAAEYVRKGIAVDPGDATAQAELGLYLLRTGDEAGARTALEKAWTDPEGRSDSVTKNLLEMLDQLDKFVVVPHGDFIFKFAKEDADVLKPYALPLADQAYKTYTERYGFKPSGPILIEVFPRHDDFAVRTVGLMGLTGALGACFGRVVTMDSPRARPPGDFSWQATEWHELAHVFTLQLSDYRVPRWLTEGLSVYEEYRRVPAWGRELAPEFARNLAKKKTFGVKGMPAAFKHPESLSLAYFEASLVVEHLIDLNGDAGVRTLLKAYADGANDTDAFAKAFGKSIDDVEKSFAAFVQQKYGALSAAMADPPSTVDADNIPGLRARAAAAPGNFASQWTLGRALVQAGDAAGARPVLDRAAQLAPEMQGDASPHALLAAIAEKEGDLTRARRELRALLKYDHTNVEAARKLAKLGADAKADEDEDVGLRLVADLQPFDVEVHSLLGKRELAKGHQETALVEFQAALALRPPNLAEAHTDVGEVLLALGRKDEAKKAAISALQEAPTYARAQDLLLAAIGR